MIEELREEGLIRKVGGRFRLSTLIQKRLVQINAGARPLVETRDANNMQIVINEIMQDKIFLDSELRVQVAAVPSVLLNWMWTSAVYRRRFKRWSKVGAAV